MGSAVSAIETSFSPTVLVFYSVLVLGRLRCVSKKISSVKIEIQWLE
jgi:hypothetical protein